MEGCYYLLFRKGLSGTLLNSGHVVVPKAWIGKEAVVTLKEAENKISGKSKPSKQNVTHMFSGAFSLATDRFCLQMEEMCTTRLRRI